MIATKNTVVVIVTVVVVADINRHRILIIHIITIIISVKIIAISFIEKETIITEGEVVAEVDVIGTTNEIEMSTRDQVAAAVVDHGSQIVVVVVVVADKDIVVVVVINDQTTILGNIPEIMTQVHRLISDEKIGKLKK